MKKKYLLLLPEIIIVILSAYWFLDNYLGRNVINPFALAVFFILLFQVIFQNKFIGMFLATITALFSIYMVFAVMSEFREFSSFTPEARNLLIFGLTFCILLFASSIIMIYKFLSKVF
ncbi:hypothetical protein [Flavobacterium wongokense]|uniref:hypothetical protein n=1 Tax=Flavobacterium wongokense TaxID=2910674 RepID=UPI001F2C619B|nr:hypothetical protein [Flavobacterium sp. WG47]MCF6130805.1 hypothetical protein [Flavobacterium sp. WG47]